MNKRCDRKGWIHDTEENTLLLVWEGKKSRLALKCISWHQYCPDYEMIEWNEENFDIDMNGYTRMCYAEKSMHI